MNAVEKAFHHYPREEFLQKQARMYAEEDRPIGIGYGQTNSQPTTVRQMLQWLDVRPGDGVLDIGSGSGWTTALLSYLTGNGGTVHATEVIPELVKFGRDNCKRLGVKNAHFHQADDTIGWGAAAPYDKILVSASADQLPLELVAQLRPGDESKMVIPVQDEILEVTVDDKGDIFEVHHPGFVFVPLLATY